MAMDDLEFEPMPIPAEEQKQIEAFVRLSQEQAQKAVGIPADLLNGKPKAGYDVSAFERIFGRK